nr:MAG TPA: cytochrome c protein [Caudoviricetes sp.]
MPYVPLHFLQLRYSASIFQCLFCHQRDKSHYHTRT